MSERSLATPSFAALLVAEMVSNTGTEMAAVALPWFVLVTTGSPGRMGAVMAAEFVGMALLGVPGGRAVAALGPRRSMLASDLARALLVAAIPALQRAGLLSFPLLVAVAFAVGAFFPAYQSSQQLVLAALAGDDEVLTTRAGGLLGAVNETASFAGPALGGVLVALLGPGAVLLIDAASFLFAFALVAALVPAAAGRAMEAGGRLLDGVRAVARDRRLLARVLGLGVIEIGFTALTATLPVAALRRFGGDPRLAGWFLGAFGAGSMAGGLVSSRTRSAGDRATAAVVVVGALTTWPLLAPVPAWAVLACVAANGVCAGLFFPRFFAALTIRTAPSLRALVMTAVTTGISAFGPLGFVAAGLLLQRSSSPTAGFALTAATATAGAAVVAAAALAGSRRPAAE